CGFRHNWVQRRHDAGDLRRGSAGRSGCARRGCRLARGRRRAAPCARRGRTDTCPGALLLGQHRRTTRGDLRARHRTSPRFRRRMKLDVAQRWWMRAALVVPIFVAAGVLLWWRGPDWGTVGDAFTVVAWWWVVAAILLNLLSVICRSLAWNTVIKQAMPPPRPSFPLVFSAFCVGLFANVVLPARAGELARVAVLSRRLPRREGVWATLVGTVFAHRVFDLIPSLLL